MAIKAGEVSWSITADISSFNDALAQSSRAIEKHYGELLSIARVAGTAMMAAGTGVLASMFKVGDSFAKAADDAATMGDCLGMSAQAVQEYQYALEMLDTPFEAFESGMKIMERQLGNARVGIEQAAKAFGMLRISMQEVMTLTPDQMFMRVADAISKIRDPAQQAAAAQLMFGRGAMQLLPALKAGSAGIQQYRDEAHRLGLVMSDSAINIGQAYDEAMKRLQASFTGFRNAIAPQMAQFLTQMMENVRRVVMAFSQWAQANPQLAAQIIALAAHLATIMIPLGAILVALSPVVKLFSGLGSVIGVVITALGGLSAPVVALIAAIAALGAAIYMLWRNWDSVIGAAQRFAVAIQSTVIRAFVVTADEIIRAWSAVVAFFQWAWNAITSVFVAAWSRIQPILQKLQGAWAAIKGAVGFGGSRAPVHAFASGGVARGGFALVGERGAELAALPAGTRILSHRETVQALNQSQDNSVNISGITINVSGSAEPRSVAREVASRLGDEVKRSLMARGIHPMKGAAW